MAIKDKQITIKGDAARVASLQIFPQPDGTAAIVVVGVTRDSDGRAVEMKEAQLVYEPSKQTNDAMRLLLELAIGALRKVNGLEDAALPIEPKVETIADVKPADAAPPAPLPKR